MPPGPRLRDRLCALEPHDPLLRERYTQEIRAMLEKDIYEHASRGSQALAHQAKELHGAKMARNLLLDERVDNDGIEDCIVTC